jgi:hypothetical protein
LLKGTFIGFFRGEEAFESEVTAILLEKYIDFNRFKEVKQFIRERRLALSLEVYDGILSRAIENQLRHSRNINLLDEHIRRILDFYDEVKRTSPKSSFPRTNRKRNLLKLISVLKNWNIELKAIDFTKVLEMQSSKHCNQIVSRFYRFIKNDQAVLLDVPFVKIKRKLVKSADFSGSYLKDDAELNPDIFDTEFCTFLISMA